MVDLAYLEAKDLQERNFRNDISQYDTAFQEAAYKISLSPNFTKEAAEVAAKSLKSLASRDDGHWKSFLPYIVLVTGLFSAMVDTGASPEHKRFIILVKALIVLAGSGGAFFISDSLNRHVRVITLAESLLDAAAKYHGKAMYSTSHDVKVRQFYKRHLSPLQISGATAILTLIIILLTALLKGVAILP